MDLLTTWWLVVWSVLGYLIVGLGVGAIVSNLTYEEGRAESDAYALGFAATMLWPIALVIMLGAVLWFYVISKALTPRKLRLKQKEEAARRLREGKPPIAQYVD